LAAKLLKHGTLKVYPGYPHGMATVHAEQINADKGIGFLINNARDFLRIDIIIFCLVIYALLGIGTDAIVRALEHRALRYRT